MPNNEERLEIFKDELKLIEYESIRNFTQEILTIMPDYFFEIPASSTGKYHPKYGLGTGGLVRHTRAAVKIAHELFNLEPFHPLEKSIIISSLILHDGCKNGKKFANHTIHAHPIIMVEFIHEQETPKMLVLDILSVLCGAIASHMGQWNTNDYSSVTLPLPQTGIERFVHLCDYLASRRFIEVIL